MESKKEELERRKSQRHIRRSVFFAGECCLEKKADDVVVLDLRGMCEVTDYFLIAGGYTDLHVRALAEHVIETMEKRFNLTPWHVEGMENGTWVLLDYIDFVVHLFQAETRNFYQLEKLWADARRYEIVDRKKDADSARSGMK